jgi:hypothetical protein
MKKQILILAIFMVALIASTSTVLAQTHLGARTTPAVIDPLSCVGTSLPLHPFAGVSYTYTMTTPGPELVNEWTWFATKENTFINGSGIDMTNALSTSTAGQLLAASANYGVATAAANSVSITWTPEILSSTVYQGVAGEPTFVVGYATGANCADNIQVFEINPQVNFTIDIANIDDAGATLGWDVDRTQCVDDVQSAIYNNTSHEIDMDYGTNTLYFEVTAANFNTDWTPTFRLVSGLTGTQTAVVTLHATYADAVADANIAATANWTAATVGTDWATGVQFDATNASDVVDGVSLFVKVVISNLTEESLAASTFSLAVDAQDNAAAGIWDMEDADCTTLTDLADQLDVANHTINPRPTLNMDGAAMSEPSTVNPENVITKTP